MFTGIITHTGILEKRNGMLFTFKAPDSICKQMDKGASISINGVCLTVLGKPSKAAFYVEIMPETIKRTMLDNLKKNDLINLELPVAANDLLSGHIVQGHIDGIGKVINITKDKNSIVLVITFPKNLSRYIAEKGSITINGISLTVISVNERTLAVGIVPYTFKHTMIQNLKSEDLVNIEVDILAKYVEKLLGKK